MNKMKFEGLQNASSEKRYKSFVSTVADTEIVWLTKKNIYQVWPSKEHALALVSIQSVFSMDVHEFCDILSKSSINIQVFPTVIDYFEISPGNLLKDLQNELERIE